MGKQRDILPKVLQMILQQMPDASVFLSGSVNFGYERPESDLDICVAVSDLGAAGFPGGTLAWQDDGARGYEATVDGVRLDLVVGTRDYLEQRNVRKPWDGYYLTRVEIVHDPTGFIRAAQARIASWFDSHEDIAAFWEQWIAERRIRAVTHRQQEGDLVRKYPTVWDMWAHLDPMFEKASPPNQAPDAIAESAPGADPSAH